MTDGEKSRIYDDLKIAAMFLGEYPMDCVNLHCSVE